MAQTSYAYFSRSPTYSSKNSRHYPLTPPCVSPPAVSTCTYSTRPESQRSQSSSRASTLLSAVASKAPSRHSSPPATPQAESCTYQEKLAQADARSWRQQQVQSAYISFPDFERYVQQYSQDSGQEESASRTS